jgi:DNA-binding SARP family transcriptional activator
MSDLRISLLGEVRVTGSRSAEIRLTPILEVLLAYLLLHRQRCHPREILIDLFWGDQSQEQARHCLSTALWRLRRRLEPPGSSRGTYLVTTTAGHVGFNGESDYWLDVEAFERPLSRTLTYSPPLLETNDAQELEQALQFYTGDLLEGFYDDWVLRERERLRALYLHCLVQLMGYYRQQHAYEKSLACGQKILNCDPLREEIHREMMRLYLENGQRPLAVRQYELCAQTLSEELDILPMEETQRLYAEITQVTHRQPLIDLLDEPASWLQMLPQLHLMLEGVEATRAQLQQMIAIAEKLAEQRD